VDVVVASPGRLMQHKEKANVFLSHVTHIIIDEVDTMLTQGFGPDVRAVLRAGLNKHADPLSGASSEPAQVVMCTATLTKPVKQLLSDVNGNFNIEFSDPSNLTPKKLSGAETSVHMSVVEVDGVHRSLPHVSHLVEDTGV
jgi:superfamily II DNA/RNA helicase